MLNMRADYELSALKRADKKITSEVNILLGQLSPGLRIKKEELRNVLANPAIDVVVAKESGRIVGIGSLVFIRKLSGKTAFIEDVIIDQHYRDQGLGKKLVLTLIKRAKIRKAKNIRLTSRPERVAANNLYKKLGFKLKKTNYYVLEF